MWASAAVQDSRLVRDEVLLDAATIGLVAFSMGTVALAFVARVAAGWLRQRRRSATLDRVAASYGMRRIDDEIVGHDGSFPMGARLAPHPGTDELVWTVYVRLSPPLDLGLEVTPRSRAASTQTSALPVMTGNPAFDAAYSVRADEPDRVAAILPPLVEALTGRRFFSAHDDFTISDEAIATRIGEGGMYAQLWDDRLTAARTMANWLNEATEQLRPARGFGERRSHWERFARGTGLRVSTTPFGLTGTFDGRRVRVTTVRVAAFRYRLEIEVAFEQALDLGLLIQPPHTLDRSKPLFGAEDRELGEPVFDRTFAVRVSDLEGARDLFDAPLRRLVLAVHHDHGPLSISDEGISVRLPVVPTDPAGVPRTLERLFELATAVDARRSGDHPRGPYR